MAMPPVAPSKSRSSLAAIRAKQSAGFEHVRPPEVTARICVLIAAGSAEPAAAAASASVTAQSYIWAP